MAFYREIDVDKFCW